MSDDMGMLRIEVQVQLNEDSHEQLAFRDVLVDTGSELSWFPANALDSAGLRRYKVLRFRLMVDPVNRRLVDAGPMPAAAGPERSERVAA